MPHAKVAARIYSAAVDRILRDRASNADSRSHTAPSNWFTPPVPEWPGLDCSHQFEAGFGQKTWLLRGSGPGGQEDGGACVFLKGASFVTDQTCCGRTRGPSPIVSPVLFSRNEYESDRYKCSRNTDFPDEGAPPPNTGIGLRYQILQTEMTNRVPSSRSGSHSEPSVPD